MKLDESDLCAPPPPTANQLMDSHTRCRMAGNQLSETTETETEPESAVKWPGCCLVLGSWCVTNTSTLEVHIRIWSYFSVMNCSSPLVLNYNKKTHTHRQTHTHLTLTWMHASDRQMSGEENHSKNTPTHTHTRTPTKETRQELKWD